MGWFCCGYMIFVFFCYVISRKLLTIDCTDWTNKDRLICLLMAVLPCVNIVFMVVVVKCYLEELDKDENSWLHKKASW